MYCQGIVCVTVVLRDILDFRSSSAKVITQQRFPLHSSLYTKVEGLQSSALTAASKDGHKE
jgi:hypothetical protein